MSTALAFQNTSFDVIDQNGKPWLRSPQIAEALGYSQANRVVDLYARHADEFTDSMTAVITLPTSGGPQETRIFSLRGCHLLAMFARTSVAKAFRVWVLDVLEKLGESEARPRQRLATKNERKPLVDLVKLWVSMAPIGYGPAFRQVNAAFGVASVEEMTTDMVLRATGWVQARIDAIQRGTATPAIAVPHALPALPDDLRERLKAHANKCLDFTGDVCTRARQLMCEGSRLSYEVASHIDPLFHHTPSGYLNKTRVYDAMTTFSSSGIKAIEAGTDNIYLTARLMEGLAAIR
ncbi:BRO-N domain-containing protein [Nitratidesulfovibrio vulgaris]|uniref:BRO-N domain-containing protein n=1 Tax=Nitratidesulfovibrio vulgaris TaxID=881 RepID=UPI0013DE7D39|nr:Bro-N domain-containing protein [Nitratidesulfovibrio vulgaris]